MLCRFQIYGGWAQSDAYNEENVIPHTGYVITYAGYPLLGCSKLQTEIALSTTKAEYIVLRQVMSGILTFMALMKEVSFIFDIYLLKPEIFCKVFEDNQSCIYITGYKRL